MGPKLQILKYLSTYDNEVSDAFLDNVEKPSGAADTDYDRLFLDGKEQKFYEYKGEKVYLSVEYAWSHDSIVSGI